LTIRIQAIIMVFMELNLKQFLIVCPLCFLAGFVDSIGGGGGLISLPAFMLAGLPAHMAIGTNKVQAFFSTGMSTFRMLGNRYIVPALILPPVIGAFAGSALGANLNLLVDETLFSKLMLVALPLVAVVVFNGKLFTREDGNIPAFNWKTVLITTLSGFFIGIYDGFYGPGAGTFLIIAFTVLGHFDVRYANGHAKITNLAMSIASMIVYLMNGQSIVILGAAAGCFAMLGSYIGSGLVVKNGSRIVRPVIILVIALLMLKIIFKF